MAKLHRISKKYSIGNRTGQAVFGEKTFDQVHPLGTALVKQDDAAKAAEQAVQEAKDKPAIPLPDEEELARLRRRRARRSTGRESTVLADTFGPG